MYVIVLIVFKVSNLATNNARKLETCNPAIYFHLQEKITLNINE
jgi:hypothetical protein